jgi:hypothetical protein
MTRSKVSIAMLLFLISVMMGTAYAQNEDRFPITKEEQALADTYLPDIQAAPPMKRIAIYNAAVLVYLGSVYKFHPELTENFVQLLQFTEENEGNPKGYKRYLQLIDDMYKHPDPQFNPSKIVAYGIVSNVGIKYYKELMNQSKTR